MRGVPHLNELNKKYRERGFEIVAVSSEAAGTIEDKMVKGASASFGVVKADIAALYQTNGIPTAGFLTPRESASGKATRPS